MIRFFIVTPQLSEKGAARSSIAVGEDIVSSLAVCGRPAKKFAATYASIAIRLKGFGELDDMKLAIFGATGSIGKVVLAEALQRGHEVTVLARTPGKLEAHPSLRVVQGDALDAEAVERAIIGQESVLQCLGIGGMGDGGHTTFVSSATALMIPAMEKHGVKRFVCMSNTGVGDSASHIPWLVRRIIKPLFYRELGAIEQDKERMEAIVRASSLDWTAVRFPGINHKPAKGPAHVSYDGKGLKFFITAHAGANFLLDLAASREHLHRMPSVSS